MTRPPVTVVVVPRERFSFAHRSLESLRPTLAAADRLVYVDAGSPPGVRDWIADQGRRHAFEVIRRDETLSPNAARNLALTRVDTKYVALVDNDVLFSPGWLDALVRCAEATGAWVVGPLYCEREPMATRIHMAGGAARIEVEHGRRVFREWHYHWGEPVAKVRPHLRRCPVDQVEYHAVLVRGEALSAVTPLDEALFGIADHTDLCLTTAAAGGAVYIEPEATVTWVPPPPLLTSDLPFFLERWGEAATRASLDRFRAKWELSPGPSSLDDVARWVADHRRLGRRPAALVRRALLGVRRAWRGRRHAVRGPVAGAGRLSPPSAAGPSTGL